MKKVWSHFKTITSHKYQVMKGCFKVGLYSQGMFHDLSKYMPSEFVIGAKYYQGIRSPNNAEREERGHSRAWLHHKGRNKHHFEYWMDYSSNHQKGVIVPVPMPTKYVVEMFMDRVAASKVYNKKAYRNSDPLTYYNHGKEYVPIHKDTRMLLEKLLEMLANEGEEKTFSYVRKLLRGSAN